MRVEGGSPLLWPVGISSAPGLPPASPGPAWLWPAVRAGRWLWLPLPRVHCAVCGSTRHFHTPPPLGAASPCACERVCAPRPPACRPAPGKEIHKSFSPVSRICFLPSYTSSPYYHFSTLQDATQGSRCTCTGSLSRTSGRRGRARIRRCSNL